MDSDDDEYDHDELYGVYGEGEWNSSMISLATMDGEERRGRRANVGRDDVSEIMVEWGDGEDVQQQPREEEIVGRGGGLFSWR